MKSVSDVCVAPPPYVLVPTATELETLVDTIQTYWQQENKQVTDQYYQLEVTRRTKFTEACEKLRVQLQRDLYALELKKNHRLHDLQQGRVQQIQYLQSRHWSFQFFYSSIQNLLHLVGI